MVGRVWILGILVILRQLLSENNTPELFRPLLLAVRPGRLHYSNQLRSAALEPVHGEGGSTRNTED